MRRELFRFEEAAAADGWFAIDDGVMGGQSRSSLRHDAAGHSVFAGAVSLAQGGGFASVRSRAQDLAAPGAVAYVLTARGDGKRYKLAVRCDDRMDGVSHQIAFVAAPGDFADVRLPIADFVATFRGRDVAAAPALDPAHARQMGILIADRQAGPFALALRSLRAE